MTLSSPTVDDPVAATIAAYDAGADAFASSWLTFDPAGSTDPVVALTAGLAPGARILDVGSGSGRDLRRLREAGFDALGVDASAELAKLARRYGPVLVGDVRDLHFDDGSFDAVLACAVLLHLPLDEARDAARELARVVRPGGQVVVTVKAGEGTTVDSAGRFFQLFTDTELDNLLTEAGFTITSRATDPDRTRPGTTWLVRTATR